MNYGHYDEIWDEQAREAGEPRETSGASWGTATFREMADMLRTATPGFAPADRGDGTGAWYADYGFGRGTREWLDGIERVRIYVPCDAHAARWMHRAYLSTHNRAAREPEARE